MKVVISVSSKNRGFILYKLWIFVFLIGIFLGCVSRMVVLREFDSFRNV